MTAPAALFLFGWGISRGANLQKYTFKRWPERKFLGLSIALAFGHFDNPWAWTYLVFVVAMLTCRQWDDDHLCAEKYGPEKWAEYRARVKYRIFPGVY